MKNEDKAQEICMNIQPPYIDFIYQNYKTAMEMAEWKDQQYQELLEKQGKQNNQHLYDIIIALWDLLDKIDTFSDLQIDDTNPDNPFRKIEDITQERHKFVKSDGYDLFIEDFMITNDKNSENQGKHKETLCDKCKIDKK